ncbi:putative nuclear pore complex subunit Nup133 [Aspergillus homomorphus CBS 101889]|uniref:Nuclear pore complex subunit Nup133 n=1 Tax=Aspergillus homomorphus (strain CBS 101889) TaxID=1450537 RepID=A0A395I8H8_ASPHC|nr:hypothetical protein BO97DRAFT_467879 [Aspergillus homomorphus CBS 101889]RAL16570.1 hypothetical protein BO97DRAFT_467879 [Aspergillus homomorphus CBS 101889]
MFVPKTALGQAAALRNPRRRQRTNSDETTQPPNAKRQRSALRQECVDSSFEVQSRGKSRNSSLTAGNLDSFNTELPATKIANIHKDIPIRAAKRPGASKNEVGKLVILSQTDFYKVEQLPALPDQVVGLQSEPLRVVFGSSYGLALALTRSHAIIWPYSGDSQLRNTDILTLPLPKSYMRSDEAAPLGQLLSTAVGGSPGLIVVTPNSGHIVYWETITSATSLVYTRQKQSGLEGSISGLLSGEHATDVINCEPSGVIVKFSTGRVAHVTVRDPQGKPAVTASFLRNPPNGGRIGFLGGLRNALGGGYWRKDIAAVQAGQSHQRGQRDVIIATTTGFFEVWDTHWNNGSLLKRQFDVRPVISDVLAQGAQQPGESDIEILDFVFTTAESNTDNIQSGEANTWNVLVIVASRAAGSQELSVLKLKLSEKVRVLFSTAINHRGLIRDLEASQIKLFVPNPGDVAFLVAGQSVILLSLSSQKQELLGSTSNNNHQAGAFHDIINLRSGKGYDILGSGCESRILEGTEPACVIMVRGFGILRISAFAKGREAAKPSTEIPHITAKHRIEQAIFYGTIMENPLDLTNKDGLGFPLEEVEEAALEVAKELLQSTSKYIPTTGISVDQNLKLRAKAFDDLSSLLMQQHKVMNRLVWWELLWGAEKIAAQRAIWKLEEHWRKENGRGQTLLADILESMSERFKTHRNDDGDPVRHWFLYDTFQLEHIVPWIYNSIKPRKGNSLKQGWKTAGKLLGASDLSLAVLETAYHYRDEHASRYGIVDGYLEDGVLTGDYKGLSEFWTSRGIGYVETIHLLDLELDSCRVWIQQKATSADAQELDTVKKIGINCARQFHILGQVHRERVRWLAAQEDTKLVDEGVAIEHTHAKQRKWQLFKLAGIGHLQEAIRLAESFRDMEALVELIIELQDQTKGQSLSPRLSSNATRAFESASDQLSRKISGYFDRFGQAWAEAFFSRQISLGQGGVLFAMKKFQPFVTNFLRGHSTYSRLSWINDVVGENDYNAAADSLEKLALDQESDLWGHRLELSLAKLAKLSAWEDSSSPGNLSVQGAIKRLEDLAEIDAVQEVIFAHIAPTLQCAIDQKARVDIAVSEFGERISKDRPSLFEILKAALTKVVSRQVMDVEELVDLLTLAKMPGSPDNDHDALVGKEDYLALRVIRLSSYAQQNPQYDAVLQKLVWKRCLIKDDWGATGKAAENMGSDFEHLLHGTALARTLSWCYRDGLSEDSCYPTLYIPRAPQELLLDGSNIALLTARFSPERRARIHHDLERENSLLSHYIKSGKLEFWFKTLVESLRASYQQSTVSAIQDEHDSQSELQIGRDPGESHNRTQLKWL